MLFLRELLQLDDETWLVSDLGGWGTARGAVWTLAKAGTPAKLSKLLSGLNLPHALALGADGKVYVGEMSRIFRFDPRAADPSASIETVVANLPDNRLHENRHPLSAFAFAQDGALLVNIGAPVRPVPGRAWPAPRRNACARKANPANAPRASVATRPTATAAGTATTRSTRAACAIPSRWRCTAAARCCRARTATTSTTAGIRSTK